MRTRLLGVAAVTAAAIAGLAGPASAIDADRRWGDRRPGDRPDVLVARAKPEVRCLRVQTVPAYASNPILYIPCSDDVRNPMPARPGLKCHRVRVEPARVEPILYIPCPASRGTPRNGRDR